MNPTLLRRILTWAAPVIIGFVVKKFEEKQARKQQQKAMANSGRVGNQVS